MAMNMKKVVVGGIIAGIVLVVVDFILNGVIFADRMKAEMDAFKPGLSTAMEGSSAMTVFIICDLVMGLVLVWLYAAIRPRFGPGPKTAATAAFVIWIVGGILMSNYLLIGMMSMGSWWMYAFAWLVNLVIATMIGARFYTEEGAPAMAAA